jgi:hypothetical protein
LCGILNYALPLDEFGLPDNEAVTEQAKAIQAAHPEVEISRAEDFVEMSSSLGWPLRGLVNQWIESGKRDGIENPYQRRVPDGVLTTFNAVFSTELRIDNGGHLRTFYNKRNEENNAEAFARSFATLRFIQLLDHPDRERLSRCDGCRSYFLHQRQPKKGIVIKHGTFCRACKGKGRAKSTKEKRGDRKKQLVQLAARLWVEYADAKHRSGRSEWVVEQMTEQMRRSRRKGQAVPSPITKKWVTQNRKPIEDAARELSQKSNRDTDI